jgi:hypothetical protein
MIYEQQEGEQLHYIIKERISQNFECSLMVICTNHIVLCHVRRLFITFHSQKLDKNCKISILRFFQTGKETAIGQFPGCQGA